MLLCLPSLVLAQAGVRVTIGGEGDRGAALGDVLSVAVFPTALVVLERTPPFLRVFGPDGRLRQTLGRLGAGPGEFRAPSSLAVDSAASELWIPDPATARITRFRVRDTLALAATTPVDLPVMRALCSVHDRWLALAGIGPAPLRELVAREGRWTAAASIGRAVTHHPLATHPMLRSKIADGPLLCAAELDRVYVASALLGELVQIRPPSATEATIFAIPGFRPIDIRAAGAALTYSMPATGSYDRVVALERRGREIAVTVARIAPADRAETVVGYRAFVLRPDGSFGAAELRRWQPVGMWNGQAVCFQPDPVPTIVFRDRGPCP